MNTLPFRYVLNLSTRELHDLWEYRANCHIEDMEDFVVLQNEEEYLDDLLESCELVIWDLDELKVDLVELGQIDGCGNCMSEYSGD